MITVIMSGTSPGGQDTTPSALFPVDANWVDHPVEYFHRSPAQLRRLRNKFKRYPTPSSKEHMSKHSSPIARARREDLSGPVRKIADWLERSKDSKTRFEWALRDSLDELMDGQRTGRWAYQHLTKTEKTHLGTVVEVNLAREFELKDGNVLDWRISNVELDCKFSRQIGGWEIPMEMYLCAGHEDRSGIADHPALLIWICDDHSLWGAGLLQITDEILAWKTDDEGNSRLRRYNRDNKRKISNEAYGSIYWLWGDYQHELPENTIRHLTEESRDRIFANARSGQERVNQLFREVQQTLVRRAVILTVAQQEDPAKRARDARIDLRPEGIVILGHQGVHPKVANLLELEVPTKGEWLAVQLSPVDRIDHRPKFRHSGKWWAKAIEGEPKVVAPDIADSKRPNKPFEVPMSTHEWINKDR